MYSLREMITMCEVYAKSHNITFNPTKSKLLCFNVSSEFVPPVYLNGQRVTVVDQDLHLGNIISTDINDRCILTNVCDFYQRSNWLISDFRSCDSPSLDGLHMTYCMNMYGCELWNLNNKYVEKYKVAWRQVKRRIWRLPPTSHNNIVHGISNDIDVLLEKRIIKFIHNSLGHTNNMCRQLLLTKLHCVNSTFADNYKYLSYKYGITDPEWFSDLNHLLGKVKMKHQPRLAYNMHVQTVKELCALRDGNMYLDILSVDDINNMIALICTD